MRARGERTLVYGMQSSGATLVALLLAQRADSVALLDVYCGELVAPASAFPEDRPAIAKVTLSSVRTFEDQRKRFAPDHTVLVLRHPCHTAVSLSRKSYAGMGGTLEDKLIELERAFRTRASFDAVVYYEDLVFRSTAALDRLRAVDPSLDPGALDFRRTGAEVVAAARSVHELDAEYCRTWAQGNAGAHGLDPRRAFKVVSGDTRKLVGSLCPETTAAFDEYYDEMFPSWRVTLGGWWDDAISPRVRTTANKSREAARGERRTQVASDAMAMTSWAVVVVTDDKLVNEAVHVLGEVRRRCSGAPDLFCFARDLDAQQRSRLAQVPGLTVLDLADVEAPIGPHAVYGAPGLAPLFYAWFECWSERFDAYDTVVYLDVDIVVVGDLRPLTDADFYAALEVDAGSPFIDEEDPALVSLMDADGWPHPVGVRINAGVFAVAHAWRTPEQREMLHRLSTRYGRYLRVGDQSLLDLWMHANGIAGNPDMSANCQIRRTVGRPGGRAAVRHARALHFNGLKLANQKLALRNACLWLRVPLVGRDLFVLVHHALFRGRDLRPGTKRVLRTYASARSRMRALVGPR